MSDWHLVRRGACADFIDRLEQRGFSAVSEGQGAVLHGSVAVADVLHPVRIEVGRRFPFHPPRVVPEASVPRSWHRERDGAMCLYAVGDRDGLPWLDVDDFLHLVSRWFEQTMTGWTADSPDLDLERYFDPVDDHRLVVYSDLDPLVNGYIRLRVKPHIIEVLGPGSVPRRQKHRNRLFGFVLDLGEPAKPPSTWEHITELVAEDVIRGIERAIRERRISMLLLRYARNGTPAVLAVQTTATRTGILLRSYPSASAAHDTLRLRAGLTAEVLTAKSVCVIGAGALGSFICDLLVRAGVGHLTIRDADIVRPGNLIRHLVGGEHVGLNKATAVRGTLQQRPYCGTIITAIPDPLTEPDNIPGLFAQFDLIIDATADASVSEMLAAGARALTSRFLSACLQDDGRVVRVDVIPPLNGKTLPDVSEPRQSATADSVYEGGCGSPVSQTPAFAVTQAAALTVRHAIGLLTGSPVRPAGEAHTYHGHPGD
ncbi:HesA/MoeB/ThiF family protein [Rhodococcus aetherivorans]|uniref:HesA/MoeB/ThiF family protein n=1 Tax=Rhodococcus aetherivorans TaxID=191292 RepID=UPI001639E020|nr:ThiF family adenylyltransferase [Rhodococcus aetherivorans]MBC2592392.1 ThiF family adenylyltransferase [Rhodococcus aetherivorans]